MCDVEQSINQSPANIHFAQHTQSINQTTKQSAQHSVSQSVNQSVNHSAVASTITSPLSESINRSIMSDFASTITSPLSQSINHSISTDVSNLQSPLSLTRSMNQSVNQSMSPSPVKRPVSSPVIVSPEQAYQHVITSPFHPKPRAIPTNQSINQSINQSMDDDRFDLTAFQADYNLTMLKVDLLTQPFSSSRMQSTINQSINQSINPSIRPLHTPQPDIVLRTRSSNHSSLENIHDMMNQSFNQSINQSKTQSFNLPINQSINRSKSCVGQPRYRSDISLNLNQSIHQPAYSYNIPCTPIANHFMKQSLTQSNQSIDQSIDQTTQLKIAQIAQDYDQTACRMPRFVYEEKLRSLLQAMETVDVRSPAALQSVVNQSKKPTNRLMAQVRHASLSHDTPINQSINQSVNQPSRKTKSPGSAGSSLNNFIHESTGSSMIDDILPSSSRSRVDQMLNAKRVKLLAMAAASH